MFKQTTVFFVLSRLCQTLGRTVTYSEYTHYTRVCILHTLVFQEFESTVLYFRNRRKPRGTN